MWYGLILTENPGTMFEKKVVLWPVVNSTDTDAVSRLLLEELERRAQDGWRIFSTTRQADCKKVWSLVDERGKVNHLEIVTIPNSVLFVLCCS